MQMQIRLSNGREIELDFHEAFELYDYLKKVSLVSKSTRMSIGYDEGGEREIDWDINNHNIKLRRKSPEDREVTIEFDGQIVSRNDFFIKALEKFLGVDLDDLANKKLTNVMSHTGQSKSDVIKSSVALYQFLLHEERVRNRTVYTATNEGKEIERLKLLDSPKDLQE